MKPSSLFAVLVSALVACSANAQVSFQVPITLRNGTADSTTLLIGVNTGNTIGMDTATTLGSFRETPAPPAPPSPFAWDARLVTIPGRVSTFPIGLSGGTLMDYRGYVSATQIDTFKIKIDGDDPDANPTEVSWPSNLSTYASAWLIKPQSGSDWSATDMLAATSVNIPAGAVKNILIVKTGAMGSSAVNTSGAPVAARFELAQNFPNPFNPSTTIQFSVPQTGKVRLVVYSLLGQEIRTLVDGVVAAGVNSVRFDGARFASGVYIYRLETQGRVASHSMILLK